MRAVVFGDAHGGWRAAKAARIDAELRAIGRGLGALRLELGEALERMLVTQGHHALGFSSIEAYARERCGLSVGPVRQLRAVARRLGGMERLRAAVVEGRVGLSMAELVSRHVTAESEAFLVALAERVPVARMRELLREKKRAEVGCGRLARTVDARSAWVLEQTRMFVEAHCGSRSNDAVFEALLAEGTTELLDCLEGEPVGVELREDCAVSDAPDVPAGPMGSVQRRRSVASSGEAPAADDPPELDRRCVALARQLARRDLRIAELTLELRYLTGYGCSEAEYAEQVLGMSRSALTSRHTLLRRLSRLPELQEALEEGRIGMEAASLVARVATQGSVEGWVRRAAHRTVKHLAEEVRFVERVTKLAGAVPAGPPTRAQMAHAQEVERGVLRGELCELVGFDAGAGAAASQMSAGDDDDPPAVPPHEMGRVRVQVRMREDLVQEYRRVERAWDRAGQPGGDFVAFLCAAFWRAWGHVFDDDAVEYEEIYKRERYQCASPTCERRDLTPHHLVFRSQGGGDEDDNVVGLCTWCHLHGIHTHGAIHAEPPATQMTWKTPVLEVRGRELVWRRD